jgi:hypothetical protein
LDLADWEDALKQPFEPWIDRKGDEFVLRWSGFDRFGTAREVHENAAFIVDQLNAAMEITRGTRPVRYQGGVVAFHADGTRHDTIIVAAAHFEGRSRVAFVGVAMGPDRKEIATPPQPTDVQQWIALGTTHELLVDALRHFSQPGWVDLYKALECLEDWTGGERELQALNWIQAKELKRLKRTANYWRHRLGGKHKLPARPVSPSEARKMVGTLVRSALATAAAALRAEGVRRE